MNKEFKKGQTVKFKYQSKILTGKIFEKWAKGEGEGYNIELDDEYVDVQTKNIFN